MKFNINSQPLGAALGIIAPFITFSGYYVVKYNYMTIKEFIDYLAMAKTSAAILSLCVLANLLVFFIFIQTEKYLSAKGVLLSTFIYGGIVCYLKFFTPSI